MPQTLHLNSFYLAHLPIFCHTQPVSSVFPNKEKGWHLPSQSLSPKEWATSFVFPLSFELSRSALVLGRTLRFLPLALHFLKLHRCVIFSLPPLVLLCLQSWSVLTQCFSGKCLRLIPISTLPFSSPLPFLFLSVPLLGGCSSACIVLPLAPALSAIRGPGEQNPSPEIDPPDGGM